MEIAIIKLFDNFMTACICIWLFIYFNVFKIGQMVAHVTLINVYNIMQFNDSK